MMPNFLIIGAAKSGTTSLYNYLKQHPQIYVSPIKETEFFAFEKDNLEFNREGNLWRPTITDLESYQKQFENVSSEKAIGEISTVYLYSEKAVERIKYYIPDIKLIAILRNPVDRAYSHFFHHIRDGYEPINKFENAIKEEEDRIKRGWSWNWHYIKLGFYHNQLRRYYKNFNKSQIKIYIYEDFIYEQKKFFESLFNFIEVEKFFKPNTSKKYNVTGIPYNKFLHKLYSKQSFIKKILKIIIPCDIRESIKIMIRNRNLIKPQMSIKTKNALIELYRDDVLRLEKLIDRDLSIWLE